MEQVPQEFNIEPKKEEIEEEHEQRLSPQQRRELGPELSQLGDELAARIDEIRAEMVAFPEKVGKLEDELELAEEEYGALRTYVDGVIEERIH